MTNDTKRVFPPDHDGSTSINEDGRAVIRFERELRHPIDKVWTAITDPEQIIGWLAHRVKIDPRIGGEFMLWLGDSSRENPVISGTIQEFEQPHVLSAVFDDTTVLCFELRPSATGTTLIFSDTRPAGQRAQNSVLAGWHLRMDLLLDHFAGQPADWLAIDSERGESGAVAEIEAIYWHYRNKPR